MSARQIKNRRGTPKSPEPRERCKRENGLPGKVKYPSKAKARKAALQTHEARGVKLYVYVCPRCQAFHLTHYPQVES